MEELFTLITKTYGIAGLLFLSPLLAVYYLVHEVRRLTDKVLESGNLASNVQAQRVTDAQAVQNKLLEVVKDQAQLSTETNSLLDRIMDTLEDRKRDEAAAKKRDEEREQKREERDEEARKRDEEARKRTQEPSKRR